MPLDQEAINELKQICLEEFGEMPTDKEAWDMGIGLVNLFKSLASFRLPEKVENKDLTGDKSKS
jgi:hypothetical protein